MSNVGESEGRGNYAYSGVNKLKASLNDDARVIIYDCHIFIVQATGKLRKRT